MENIFSALTPIYYFAKFLGLFPMSMDKQGRFKTRWTDIAASCAAISVCLVLLVVNFIFYHNPPAASELLSRVSGISSTFSSTMISVMFFYQISRRHAIANFVQTVDKFDKKVNGIKKNSQVNLFIFRSQLYDFSWTLNNINDWLHCFVSQFGHSCFLESQWVHFLCILISPIECRFCLQQF